MAEGAIFAAAAPSVTNLFIAALPYVCSCCKTYICKSNRCIVVEENPPPYLVEKYGDGELATLVKLHEKSQQAIIGVTGHIGVGKTVLLKRFNNKFLTEWQGSFDIVIFVDDLLEQASSVHHWNEMIQNTIGKRLGIPPWDETVVDHRDRARMITESLQDKNFVVIIDNVMPGTALQDVGIPTCNVSSQARRKIVFSARDKDSVVLNWHTRDVIELTLDEAASWQLFCSAFSHFACRRDINLTKIARQAVYELSGSPEQIIFLAIKMANNEDMLQKRKYLESCICDRSFLRSRINKLNKLFNMISHGLEHKVNLVNSVVTEILKSCLLFCSLFPPNHSISKVYLTTYLMIKGCVHSEHAEVIIQRLLDINLLQLADEHKEGMVKVAYVYHQAALAVAEEDNGNITHIRVVRDSEKFVESLQKNHQHTWSASFLNCDITQLGSVSDECLLLETLIISCSTNLCSISDSFFTLVKKLQVLDLSHTRITEISLNICDLVNLCILNLSSTRITRLPSQMVQLDMLKNLYLENTDSLQELPVEVVAHLAEVLHVLKMNDSYSSWTSNSGQDDQAGRIVNILKLEDATKLKYLAVTIQTDAILQVVLKSEKFRRFTKQVHLKGYEKESIDITSVLLQVPHLEVLSVTSSDAVKRLSVDEIRLANEPDPLPPGLQAMFLSGLALEGVDWTTNTDSTGQLQCLSSLTISECNRLRDVSWVLWMTRLKYLSISSCQELTQLIAESSRKGLSTLKKLTLQTLPKLTSISIENDTIDFESLESMYVKGCSKLVKLSLPTPRPGKLRMIHGEQSWWNELKWGGKAHMVIQYNPIFSPNDDAAATPPGVTADKPCCSSCCPSF